ncbi:MAG: hypothetical protein QMD10_12950, partial [Desulfitobacteriaceae bacterium]|nr:hypothetical protein [Desulfitobacteriaceae bacterium]
YLNGTPFSRKSYEQNDSKPNMAQIHRATLRKEPERKKEPKPKPKRRNFLIMSFACRKSLRIL